MEARNKAVKPQNVAEYIAWQIHLSGKKQFDIAKEVGFEAANVITMIKQGKTKLPLDKIGKMAKAIGVDPVFLFGMCMKEYMPETWLSIEKLLQGQVFTENEVAMIDIIRSANPFDPEVTTSEEREALKAFAANLKTGNEVRDEDKKK